ncbi:carboxypeptidase-like regulatory domain-containing protein [Mesohalobacter halotolerans]|uniref:Alpha-2-macroglobulin domain-containing protein n=1 Tax=Mesohalobacter halotolerans TaxID=1883405 RepID=A0A4U5TSE7_9FLAO|nr:carboxypeptidase-like regulatory domain-containing protein [Mesohalobacter halotolerans]TKS57237.1 hypothetical protein FCN74_02115 [Mesohalobacter halotolerans]
MPNLKTASNAFFFVFTLLIAYQSPSQNLLESKAFGRYAYIYKISDQQAKSFFRNQNPRYKPEYFNQLIDSFEFDKTYHKPLKPGYYLKVRINGNKTETALTAVQDFNVFILNNDTDLNLRVLDLNGNAIENAELKLDKRRVKFDKSTQTYRIKKSYKDGLLSLNHAGQTFYYDLVKSDSQSFFKRKLNATLYQTPVKYVWKPVKFIIDLPADAYKSIKNHYARGNIYKLKRFFVKLYESTACLFDQDYCKTRKTFHYAVTDKPKYRPGDSLRFKAYVLNKSYKPIDEALQVYLYQNRKYIIIDEIKPYAKGGYTFAMTLEDSLDLKLDNPYRIGLKDKKSNTVAETRFYYEDYTLKGNKVEISAKTETQYKGDSLDIYINATDENDLKLMDARVDLALIAQDNVRSFEDRLFIPDTLWRFRTKLKPRSKTKISIPPDIYPKANIDFYLEAKIKTSDNEMVSNSKPFSFVYQNKTLQTDVQTDSIHFDYTENGEIKSKAAKLYIKDRFGNIDSLTSLELPCKIDINPYYSEYYIETDSLSKAIKLFDYSDEINLSTKRTQDSIYIKLNNPRGLEIIYYIYKVNKEIKRGHKKQLDYKFQAKNKQNYYVSLTYIWAGKEVKKSYGISLDEQLLNISVEEPQLIYPGKTDTIKVRITNYKNQPVENADVTAFGLSKKFNYNFPRLPRLFKKRKTRKAINNFEFHTDVFDRQVQPLDYHNWKTKAHLDSIIYYDFMYPQEFFKTDVEANDSITQFAPFVMKEGKQEAVHVIYVNNNPVYFSWNSHQQSYSFPIDSGYHNIKLRTTNKIYKLDSLYFKPNRKTIFSLDEKGLHPQIQVEETTPTWTTLEKKQLYPRILLYDKHRGNFQAYIKSRNQYFLLGVGERRYRGNYYKQFTGPVYDRFLFKTLDSLSYNIHHEPGFNYRFNEKFLKLKSYPIEILPTEFSSYISNHEVSEDVITLNYIHNVWRLQNAKNRKQKSYKRYPYRTTAGYAELRLIDKNPNPEKFVLNTIVVNTQNDSLRLYPGLQQNIHQLRPGKHRAILLFDDFSYQVLDNIQLKPNGLNVVKFDEPELYPKDFFSSALNEIIEEYSLKSVSKKLVKEHFERLKTTYKKNEQYFGPGKFVSGVVKDEDGLPIPGVNVIVKGTSIGTQTDFDGNYTLKLPNTKSHLIFSYVGFKTLEKPAYKFNDITLKPEFNHLDEVVVTSYASATINTTSRPIETMNSFESIEYYDSNKILNFLSKDIHTVLNGKVAGIRISNTNGQPGSSATVIIRGRTSVMSNEEPLYVIDGMPISEGEFRELSSDNIASLRVLKDVAATSVYGNRGANGVVVITTVSGSDDALQKDPAFTEEFYAENQAASSIRNNFSDVAYWQPTLRTDNNGEAAFEITYPDDITNWQNIVIAMNAKRQKGKYQSFTKSYKPLSARLFTPKFLIEGDNAHLIGKALNYTADTLAIETALEVDDRRVFAKNHESINATIDTLKIKAKKDNLQLTFKLNQKHSEYFDGEKRDIPVLKKGVELQKGIFKILEPGDTLKHHFDKDLGQVEFYAESNLLELLQKDIQDVVNYTYECNEQLASKLHMLLAKKEIYAHLNKDFDEDKTIKKIIKKLDKNKQDNGLWGWWKSSEFTSFWISQHVIKAMLKAENMGYKTKFNIEKTVIYFKNQYYKSDKSSQKADIILSLSLLGESVYPNVVRSIKEEIQDSKTDFHNKLKLSLALLNLDIIPDIEFLNNYQKEDIFDNVYFEAKEKYKSILVYQNSIQNTLMAYKLIKSVKSTDKRLPKIRRYLVSSRQQNVLINTYEITNVLEEILPDILPKTSASKAKATLNLNAITQTDFPLQTQLETGDLSLTNTGNLPIYISAYQSYWESDPSNFKDDFEIKTRFKNQSYSMVKNGDEVILKVDIKVDKEAKYVLLNVPIPGGFDYTSKPVQYGLEDHREYYEHQTTIFCSVLKAGEYSFEIPLIAKYSGRYSLNPAKISLMYFPTFYAHEGLKIINVK